MGSLEIGESTKHAHRYYRFIHESMKSGILISASGFIISLVTSVDRLMISTFLGTTNLGYFGLSLMLISVVSLIPAMASQVLYPRINFEFGQSHKNIAELSNYVLKPPIILSLILPFLIGPIIFILPSLINFFLPAYIPGISAAKIAVFGIYFYAVLGLTDYFLVTTGKLKIYALFGTITLLFNISIDYLFIKMNLGIEGIAFGGTLLTYFFYSSIVIGYAVSFYKKSLHSIFLYLFKIWLPFFYMILLICGIEFIFDHFVNDSLINTPSIIFILKIIIYLLGCIPFIYLIAKEINFDLSLIFLKRNKIKL
jgi:O-antigen/teichoic acid export membrane protein